MIIAVFLGVLVLALLIGNALLFFIPKKNSQKISLNTQGSAVAYAIPETQGLSSGTINPAVKTLVTEERISLLNKRIARLEEIVSMQGKGIGTDAEMEFAQKIIDLQESRRQAHLEIEALKQRLAGLRKELSLEPDDTKKRTGEDIPKEQLHALAFRRH